MNTAPIKTFTEDIMNSPMTIATAFTTGDRIYLSGPISQNDISPSLRDNLAVFHEIYNLITMEHGMGLTVMNPACVNQNLEYDEMMRRDFAMLNGCSHILMLPNWQHSKGACSELLIANQLRIKARYLLPDKQTVVRQLLDCTALKRHMLETIEGAITIL